MRTKTLTALIASWLATGCASFGNDAPPPVTAPPPNRPAILKKLRTLRIAELNFRQTRVEDAVAVLQQASVDGDPARRGVNMVFNPRRGPEVKTDTATESPGAAAAASAQGATGKGFPLITFKARDLSLLEALDAVVDIANLKYRIEGNVLMIVPADAPDGSILHRSYTVLPTIEQRVQAVNNALKAAAGPSP